ncbi:MAG: hypothetical protein HY775_11230 [Acidobacteria bacterium]|nr:hypothetical protein [Acidobacteriota bacterium]
MSYDTVVNLIAGTRTKTGLKIKALLDERTYEKGVKVTDEELDRVQVSRHRTFPDWNYTIPPHQRARRIPKQS